MKPTAARKDDPMQRVYNGLFEYPNLWNGSTRCYLQVYYQAGEPLIAVATELPDNDGTSVTNGIERIADAIRRQFKVAYEDLVVIEHYLGRGHRRGRAEYPEIFSRVRFDIRGGQFRRPQWSHVPRTELETLIGAHFEVKI
jgi:hypothetical protein